MEIELKYLLKDRDQADRILSSEMVKKVKDGDSLTVTDMHAVYFDTPGHDLTKNGMAVRVRKEGDSYVATMKDRGESVNGMHRRKEINVRLDDPEMISSPDASIFRESEMYGDLLDVTKGEKLGKVLEMRFERREIRIDTGRSISMLSVDDGEMTAGENSEKIMELEIELFSGSEEDMEEFGRKLAQDFSLVSEDRSKFQRAYALLK